MAKSAMKNNLSKELGKIKCPVYLIWGSDDNITPAYVAKEFERLIGNSQLEIIEKCGHAAMMEKPKEFNVILEKFLNNQQ